MKTVIEFLTLRPVWTRRGLEAVWYLYVAATLINLIFHVSFIYTAVGASHTLLWSLALETVSVLFALAQLALVRIFLEIALKLLFGAPEETRAVSP